MWFYSPELAIEKRSDSCSCSTGDDIADRGGRKRIRREAQGWCFCAIDFLRAAGMPDRQSSTSEGDKHSTCERVIEGGAHGSVPCFFMTSPRAIEVDATR